MKYFNLKLSIFLCFLVLGIGNVYAQRIYFEVNQSKGYQNSSNHDWAYYSNFVGITSCNWGPNRTGTNSWYITDWLYTNATHREVIRRNTTSPDASDMFDWFTLKYYTPSYSKIKYRLTYRIENSKWTTGAHVRAAFFYYGTSDYRWAGRALTSSGYDHFRTANGARTSTGEGERSVCLLASSASGTSYIDNHFFDAEIDNSNNSAEIITNHYGGLSSSKSKTTGGASFDHHVKLFMKYTITAASYYKQITYYSNDGTDNTEKQAIENSGNILPASTFTRKNHIFTGWWSEATDGTKTEPGTSITVNASTKGAMDLYAQWSPVQFTFMNGTTAVGTFPAQSDNSLPTLTNKPTAGDNKFFAGYFTEAGGKGIQVYDSNLQPTAAGQAVNFEADANLYAHFVTTQHTVVWDYTYRDSEEGYKNLDDHNRFCRVQFLDKNGTAFKTVYITAPAVTNVESPTSANRTKATVVVDLAVGDTPNDVVEKANAKIYFAQSELESIHSYQFDVWTTNGSTEGTKAADWITTTNPTTNTIHFNFGKLSENMFMLKWNVTLHNLNKYPDKIFAKPMILVGENYVEIDEIKESIGEDCFMISADVSSTEVGDNTSRTYFGEFPVLKHQTGSYLATYKVGMTGFHLAGDNYYLHSTPGTVPNDFVSTNAGLKFQDETENATINTIAYEIYDKDIPIVQILPANPALGATGATVNYQPMILYVDQARETKVNLSKFTAHRTHFNFLGWYDNEWIENGKNKIWGANDDYYFHTHQVNGGTRTIFALWERDTQPDASVTMEEKENSFDYTISATDLVAVKAVKYMIASEEPAADATGWTTLTESNGKYVVTIPRTNDKYGKFLYAMVENEGKYIIIKYADPIRSFIDIETIRDDKSKVENGYWEGEGDNATWHHDGTYSYAYYSTYYNSVHAFKPVDATAYKVIVDSNNKRSLANITSTEPITNPETLDDDNPGEGPATPQAETIIPKKEAVILQGVTPKITLELVDSNVAKSGDNTLVGTDVIAGPAEGYDHYILKYDDFFGMGFIKDNETTLAAHTAYLKLDKNDENPESYTLNFKDSTVTGINDVNVNGTANGATYDLLGRKVKATNAKSGIYIKDGKKIFVK